MEHFEYINRAYEHVFQPGKLSLGIVVPIENYAQSPIPTLEQHLERVQLVEQLGFRAIWLRDVPFHVPAFGDAGQTFDPFAYLGFLAARTSKIALGVASIALPLRHPVHTAKAAATIDQLSGGRLILGVASGDRPNEYPAMGIDFESRGARFREAYFYLRKAQERFPAFETPNFGHLLGNMELLPKATGHKLPLLITGHSRQSPEWIAQNGDGWIYYPRNLAQQRLSIQQWRERVARNQDFGKPFMQPLYIDLHDDDDFPARPIHLGFRIGANYLIEYLHHLQDIGVNHLAVNLRFNAHPIPHTLERLAKLVLPHFDSTAQTATQT